MIKCKFCSHKAYGFSIREHILTHFKYERLNDGSIYFCETDEHLKELIKLTNGEKAFASFSFPCWVVEMYTEESFNRDAYYIYAPLDVKDYEDKFLNAKSDLETIKRVLNETT